MELWSISEEKPGLGYKRYCYLINHGAHLVDDVDEVLEVLRKRYAGGFKNETHIRHKKSSGYRSYHVVVEYPVDTHNGYETILAETHFCPRNFWATIEHSLNWQI